MAECLHTVPQVTSCSLHVLTLTLTLISKVATNSEVYAFEYTDPEDTYTGMFCGSH
jgi:hypothetical protein